MIFKDVTIDNKQLKRDITVILGAMVLRDIENEEKQTKLLERIGMKTDK